MNSLYSDPWSILLLSKVYPQFNFHFVIEHQRYLHSVHLVVGAISVNLVVVQSI